MPAFPPLTALELLDLFDRYPASEIVAQLRIDNADHLERHVLDKAAVYRWKNVYRREP